MPTVESDLASRPAARETLEDYAGLIKAEYLEMPGLRLTRAQACRLWNLDGSICDRILADLVAAGFLVLGRDARYRRAAEGDCCR